MFFYSNRIRTLVAMETYSSHRLKMGKEEIDNFSVSLAIFGFLAHLSRRLRGELIVYRSSRRPSVRAWVRPWVRPCAHFQTGISPRPMGR